MRIAVCLSGHFRGLQACLPTWQQHLLDPDHEFHFFVCTGTSIEPNGGDTIWSLVDFLNQHLQVKKLKTTESVLGPYPALYQERNYFKYNVQNVVSMYDKIKQANLLKCEYEKEQGFRYDVVIRFRPDIYLRSQIDIVNDLDKWHIPKFGDWAGLNDQMLWSNSANMDFACGLSDDILSYLEEDSNLPFNPEALLKKRWQKSGCPLLRPNILYQLARNNSYMLPDSETRERIARETNGTRNS